MTPALPRLRLVDSPPDALEALYAEHSGRVLKAAYRICDDMSDAEDVLQTVFLRLARTDEVNLAPNPAAYMHRAGVNAALDVVRSRARSKAVPLEVAADTLRSTEPAPDARHDGQEIQTAIRAAVARLNPRAAEMFALKYFEGYDNREIADALGMSHLVVSVLLHRARARVRTDLQKALGDTL